MRRVGARGTSLRRPQSFLPAGGRWRTKPRGTSRRMRTRCPASSAVRRITCGRICGWRPAAVRGASRRSCSRTRSVRSWCAPASPRGRAQRRRALTRCAARRSGSGVRSGRSWRTSGMRGRTTCSTGCSTRRCSCCSIRGKTRQCLASSHVRAGQASGSTYGCGRRCAKCGR